MKPIKLIISAIGPYAKEMPEIRFDDFDEKGLFLISGDTGAGKTTIFDAICFALYGEVSGSYREARSLRSEYAAEDVESFVDFYFSHQGKNYRIRRNPPYERAKKRGEGKVEEKENAYFYEENAVPIEGKDRVKKAVYELLHIDEKQFKQIAMIAQEEFLDLLNAKTEERTKILRTIFSTGGYNNIEYKLKNRMDEANKIRTKQELSISQYFNDVLYIDRSAYKEELDELSKKISSGNIEINLDRIFEMIENINKENKEKSDLILKKCNEEEEILKSEIKELNLSKVNNQFVERLQLLEKEEKELKEERTEIKKLKDLLDKQKNASRKLAPVYNNLLEKQKEKNKTKTGIENKNVLLKESQTAYELARSKLEESMKVKDTAEIKKREAQKIEEEKEDYRLRDKLSKDINLLEEKKSILDSKKESLEAAEKSLNERKEQLKKMIDSLKTKPEEYSDALAKKKALTEADKKLRNIIEISIRDILNTKNDRSKSETSYIQAREEFDKADKERADAEKILEYSRAGILAQSLKEGISCPVCGSVHHPAPAKLPQISVSEEEFKQIVDKAKKLEADKNKAYTKLQSLNTLVLEKEENLKKESEECISNEIFDNIKHLPQDPDELSTLLIDLRNKLKAELLEIDKTESLLKDQCVKFKESEEKLEYSREVEEKDILKQKELLLKYIQDNNDSLSKQKGMLESLQKLSFDNWENAEKAMNKAYAQAKIILDEIKEWEDKKNTFSQKVAAVKAEISTMESNLANQSAGEEELIKKLQDLLILYDFNSFLEIKEFALSEEDISDREKTISGFKERVSINKSKLAQAKEDAKGRKIVDIEELESRVKARDKEVEGMKKEAHSLTNKIDSNKDKYKNIKAIRSELEKSGKEYAVCKRLYELVKGQTGKGKITLEQYVQAAGFDGIIRAANRRLLPMTDGQYELYRTQDELGKRSNTFLDLEALDNYTGHRRAVWNLSGGESFKASLSLALGLSDTVSSNLGGIQMDALFIDEGFGTLDKKSIENAMDILLSLSNTNKLVGIISHREELKYNIPQKIMVEKTRNGSSIRVERD